MTTTPTTLSYRTNDGSETDVPLVVLHPGGTDSRSMDAIVAELGHGYRVVLPDQRGHGRTPDTDGPFSFEDMAADTADLIESLDLAPVHVLGHSDGAIVALHLALSRPELVRSVVFAGGVFHHDGWVPGTLDGEAPAFLGDAYGEVSPDGRGHWPVVVEKLSRLHAAAPALSLDDLRSVRMPVLVVVGDDDEPRFEHILEMYRSLPDGELAVIPRASHGFIVEKPQLLATIVRDFHAPDKDDGFAPIRRARG